ncbi:hypothetical protein DRQ32_03505 [bacterium]|nr:MAG: hypothetical protein DRQ32_03505 [bacterium]
MRASLLLLLLCLGVPALADGLTPVDGSQDNLVLGSSFTYHGRLVLSGTPVNQASDLRFSLWDASAGGTQIGADITIVAAVITDGLFSVELNFGTGAFAGDARWIEIEARTPAGSGGFTTLTPRQEINAVPYALHALNGGGGGSSGYWEISNSRITNVGSTQVLINRDYIVGSEWFGVHAPTSSYGGMYITTDGDSGKPFYGYKAGAGASMWTYQDGATLEWRVSNGGDHLKVRRTGEVDVGTTISLDNYDDIDQGGSIELRKLNGTLGAKLQGSTNGGAQGGTLALYNDTNATATVVLDGEYGGAAGGALVLRNSQGATSIELGADFNPGERGLIRMFQPDGTMTIQLDPNEGGTADQGAAIKLYDDSGNLTIELDSDYGSGNEGRVITEVIQITGGADFSEQFDMSCGPEAASPGSVVSIDPSSPGDLCLSSSAYDRRVAGIISGAGGVKPGLLMGQRGTEADGKYAVALSGRVYCKVDASFGAVEPGDLLTTSPTTGHAMKVSDSSRASGAIIGKAMTVLESGRGLVLVLVSLQ